MENKVLNTVYNYCPQCKALVDPEKDGELWICPKHGTDTVIAPDPGYCTADLLGKENVGFIIIAAKDIVNDFPAQIVLGFRRTSYAAEYVTWLYNGESKGYFFGHYFLNFEAAVKDYEKRD